MTTTVTAGVVGFTGYSGLELVALLRRHPHVTPVVLDHRAAGDAAQRAQPASALPSGPPAARRPLDYPLGGVLRLPFSEQAFRDAGLGIVFLATPPEVSMELAPQALAAGLRVIDLSGAFRLRSPDAYQRWYGAEHARPDLLAEAAYGLPELNREATRAARLVANPGCYPTAASLALRPLVAAGVLDRAAGVVCDAKSGVTGAGKAPTAKTHFCSAGESFSAYSVLRHRHVPEILAASGLSERDLSFTAQLLPVRRGILETIYARVVAGVTRSAIAGIYEEAYGAEPFVRLYPEGAFPTLDSVVRTNCCDIGVELDASTGRLVLVVAIDNLVKGAAGQAVQNMNLVLGYPETDALI